MKHNRWLAKAAALVIAICLAMGVMSPAVFAEEDRLTPETHAAEQPEATFVVLDGTSGEPEDMPEVTDNRQSVPLYINENEIQAGVCDIVNGMPYMNAEEFCRLLGLQALVSDTGAAYSLSLGGMTLTAQAGQPYIVCNGRYLYVDGGVQLMNGQLLLPLKLLVKCLGVTASWDRIGWRVTVGTRGMAPMENGDTYYDDNDLYWLSRLIYAKAGNQPLEAQVAVGDVCINRLGNEAFPGQNSIYEVIFAKNQFDVAANGMIYMEPDETATLAAKLALEGCDLSEGATYVGTASMGEGYECLAKIGELYFSAAAA